MLLRLLLLASLAPSLAYAESVPVEPPRFCGNHVPELTIFYVPGRHVSVTDPLDEQTLFRWASYACDKPDDRLIDKEIAALRRAMVKRWGISVEATNTALAARLDIKAYEAEWTTFCHSTKRQTDTTTREDANASALARLAGCTKTTSVDYLMDQHPDAPQTWRAAAVMACFDPHDLTKFDEVYAQPGYELQRMVHMTTYARCAQDLGALDRTKLLGELAKEPRVTPRVKVAILENYVQSKAWADKLTAAYKALAAKNPDVQAAVFDAPLAASTAWLQRYTEQKADFDVVIEIERAAESGRRASKGCAAKARPVFARLLARSAPKSVTEAEALVADAFLNRALRVLAYCEDLDGNAAAAVCLRPTASPPRGPRDAAMLASVARIKEVQAAEPGRGFGAGNSMYYNVDGDLGARELELSVTGACIRDEPAVIKAIKKTGDTATITFKTESQQRMGRSCRDTKRLQSVNPANGTIKYYQDCVDTGMVTVKTTLPPLETLAAYTTGLAPGQSVIVGRKGADDVGIPLIQFTDAKATKVRGLYGL